MASLSPNSRRGGRRDANPGAASGAAATGGARPALGQKYALVFTGRLLVTLVHLRAALTREALGVTCQAGSSTIGRAIGEIRPRWPGLRLRTLADVFTYAQAENVTLRIDGAGTQVRRPRAGHPGWAAFVSGQPGFKSRRAFRWRVQILMTSRSGMAS